MSEKRIVAIDLDELVFRMAVELAGFSPPPGRSLTQSLTDLEAAGPEIMADLRRVAPVAARYVLQVVTDAIAEQGGQIQ